MSSQFDSLMALRPGDRPNLRQFVPLLNVSDLQASLRFYRDGLGFRLVRAWQPEGELRWCWLEREGVSLMLQTGKEAAGTVGHGVCLCLLCADAIALFHETSAKGLAPAAPVVGNGLWVLSFSDPDGYRLDFESPAEAAEDSVYTQAG